jgi:hypothetical protein
MHQGTFKSFHIKLAVAARKCVTVEGLYCKRPIQCLASSEQLTPHPLTARRVCTTPPLVRRGGHTRWVERGGVNSSEDARHCNVLFICK